MDGGVFVGLGSNLASPPWSAPRDVLEAAIAALALDHDIRILRRSRWYRSPPDPPSSQPWYINGVAEIGTALQPAALLARLHAFEARFGRVRRVRNEARSLDLDLLAYGDLTGEGDDPVLLPHPRLHVRAFVLAPLCDIAPTWRHPRLQRTAEEMLADLAPGHTIEPLGDGDA